MPLFNSLGSNYNFSYVLKSLIYPMSNPEARLINLLNKKYQGQTHLFYKGRQAITAALEFSHLPEGSKVVINGYTCLAVWQAVEDAGLEPIQLDPPAGKMDYTHTELKTALEKNKDIKAIIIQHTLGFTGAISQIKQLAEQNNLIIIEDLAHSAGASYSEGSEVGTQGDFTILSFSQDKIIDAVSGGALIDRRLNPSASSLGYTKLAKKQYVRDRLYPLLTWLVRKTYQVKLGKVLHKVFKSTHVFSSPMALTMRRAYVKLPSWHAKLALLELQKLASNIESRRQIAGQFVGSSLDNLISDDVKSGLSRSACLRLPVLLPNAETTISQLSKQKIYLSDRWFDAPIAPKKYATQTKYILGTCPNAEKTAEMMLNLPTHVNITKKQLSKLAEGLSNA